MRAERFIQEHKQTLGLTAALLGITALALALCLAVVLRANRAINEETEWYLSEVSQQVSARVTELMDTNLRAVQTVSENTLLFVQDHEKGSRYFNTVARQYGFLWLGYAAMDGTLTTTTGRVMEMSAEPTIQRALSGQQAVSDSLVSLGDGNRGILYAVPYFSSGEIKGAVVAWSTVESMQALLEVDSFGGEGFFHVIDLQGNFILRSRNKNAAIKGSNFFDILKSEIISEQDTSVATIQAAMAKEKSGGIHFTLGKTREAMNYIPVNHGRWYLLSVVPTRVYEEKLESFTYFAVALNLAICALFILLNIFVVLLNKRKNREITKIAYEDPITGGFTSARFKIEVRRKMESFEPFAFVSMDIRKFKLINDSFGSVQGNRVLKHMHDVIKSNLQKGEAVARISSDIFNVMLCATDQKEVVRRLEKMTEDLNAFNVNNPSPYYFPVDCGIYILTEPGPDIITIRDRANSARKSNKMTGSQNLCSCVFYSDLERIQLLREKELENSMERALTNHEFVIYLQPKVGLEDCVTIGAEALVRWNDPEKGLLQPGEFIPFFERNGFILKLDMYVFEEVCKLLRKWIDSGLTPIPISVNLSRVHLREQNFLEKYKAIQQKYKIPPQLLEIEITETLVFENLEYLKQVITDIHKLGFQCSLDDFGSGYSSLNVLKEVSVDTLKLDKAFFDKENDRRSNDVVESVINLAKKLGMTTVSEGVETVPQVEFLRKVNCDVVQGYVFSKPVQVGAFEKMTFEDGAPDVQKFQPQP